MDRLAPQLVLMKGLLLKLEAATIGSLMIYGLVLGFRSLWQAVTG
jgi:hypothetical protein